jgi:hypothetical protein
MNLECLKCKGRNLCARPFCPIQAKINSQKKVNLSSKQDFYGESPNVFVGKFGYPNINVGFLSVEQYDQHDAPLLWSKEGYGIDKIIDLRSQLVDSTFKTQVTGVRVSDKLLDMGKEIAMASAPVNVEINLEKKPEFRLSFNQDTMPHGPRVKLKKAELTSNPKIPTSVEKVVSDIDLRAADAL